MIRRSVPRILLLCMAILGSPGLSAQVITLQFGAQLPPNSPYDVGLQKLAAEWSKLSGGRVKLVFPRTVANSSQDDIIQKMKFQLDGALFDPVGLSIIYPDSMLLTMPSLIKTEQEYDAALSVALPAMKRAIGDRFEVLGIAQGGWLYLFSEKAIVMPEDFRKSKFPADRTSDAMFGMLQSLGVHTVKSDAASIMLQLNSKTIDCILNSPIMVGTLWMQYKKFFTSMTSVKLAPFYGAFILNKRSWDRIPADLKPVLKESLDRIITEMVRDSRKIEADAISSMKKDGLLLTPSDAATEEAWGKLVDKATFYKYFSKDFVNEVYSAVEATRKAGK